ncbi:pyridoxal kinase PdxY [Corynebacterium sp. zg-331]|uniref:pyridoxal kinase PdxY n=1 Tax=unclassified Corynebacterium TaxID=2624378 RepID=UPI00128C3122|nr:MULTISPECIES: pyridoxal kinase PdxY [unclassified Corynebacterium]MBC3185122.1 pyridoxal kinase PdxY [Corynebacterium sp. zg-331]MPV51620.1 pyridoxal kinase PdxY [Corynebacterium sp. zg331]
MKVLSIQSAVAYGHVGNSAAVFPLQRLGHEVWPVYTVNFSNHTGYGSWRGPAIPATQVAEVIEGVAERGALNQVDAVLSGYQGGADIAKVIVETVARVKEANPEAVYACDPVMGNAASGCHVDEAIPPLLRDLVVPAADIITPNQFELGYLTGRPVGDLASTLAAVAAAREMGPSTVLVTSVEHPDVPEDAIEMLAVDPRGAWLVRTPRLPVKRNGSGDVAAALFTGHYVATGDARRALEATASSVFDLLRLTVEAGSPELELVAAQDYYAQPRCQFEARALARPILVAGDEG